MSAPRIIAGAWRGRRLSVPEGTSIRPTSERMREALFNILQSEIEDAKFLDLFAGTGAIGLEALSRGAALVSFVEQDRTAREALTETIRKLEAADKTQVLPGDASRIAASRQVFDLIYIDPPYASDLALPTLLNLNSGGYIGVDTKVIVERAAKWPVSWPAEFELIDQRRYGTGILDFLCLVQSSQELS